ncbi:MAG: pyridoxal-phosphate dependent enzyme, partial [Sporomusa sp.]
MEHKIQWVTNGLMTQKASTDILSYDVIKQVKQFHQRFPEYSCTPLRSLDRLAAHLGVAGIYVKDESYRFGLNAFKVLGGSYAMAKYLAQRLGKDMDEVDYLKLTSDQVRDELGEITFVTATDGNHG